MGEPMSDTLQAKLAQMGLDASPEEFVNSLPVTVQRRVEALQQLQKVKDNHEAQFRKERAELEAKYELLYGPLYEDRRDIVAGVKAVAAPDGDVPSSDVDTGIPEFWLTVLLKSEITQSLISEKDVDVLKYLTNITSEVVLSEDGEPLGFKLHFFFATNPYFNHPVLDKSYTMLAEDDGVLEKAEGTKIHWNAGKDVTVKLMKKKPRKGVKESKPQTKIEKVDSFFNFFSPPVVPEEDAELAEEEAEQLQAEMESDYEIGIAVKEKLIPNAINYYTGEAAEEDGYFLGDEDDDEDDGDDGERNDDGGDDDDDIDEDADAGGGGGGSNQVTAPLRGGKRKNAAGAGADKPECKQQ